MAEPELLLDTDVAIDVLRGYPPALGWLESLVHEEIILLPGFVVMELLHGCRNKVEQQKVEAHVQAFEVVWPTAETCERAVSTFAKNHLSQGIGILDALIGQLAVDLGLPLATFNQKHYAAIERLRLIQPYQKSP